MKRISIIIFLLSYLFNLQTKGQANTTCFSPVDNCDIACNLGTLPAPADCNGGDTTYGAPVTYSMTNVGGLSGNSALEGCAAPAVSSWYTFRATGAQLNINITSTTLQNPNISLYQGNNCNDLVGLYCFTGSGGNLSATYSPLSIDGLYYLQISGGTPSDVGNFMLTIQNNNLCAACLLGETFTVEPPPVNGAYQPGQTVTFCFTVTNYNQSAINWLHGVTMSLGPGWNASSLAPVSIPASCTPTQGAYWGWFQSDTSHETGSIFGPGFYYVSADGSVCGGCNDPGDNYGDEDVGIVEGDSCFPTFCWKITTNANCNSGADLSVSVRALGDYISGSWTSPGCLNDPVTTFDGALQCCPNPVITTIATSCSFSNGSAIATGGGTGPWQYTWENNAGTIIQSDTGINGSDTIYNLSYGQYSVTVVDASNCSALGIANVAGSGADSIGTSNTGPYCAGQTISLYASGGDSLYLWTGPGGFIDSVINPTISAAATAMSGTYFVTITTIAGCIITDSTMVVVSTEPVTSISASATSLCNGQSDTLTAGNGRSYSWSTGDTTAAIIVQPEQSVTYSVTVSTLGGCMGTATAGTTVLVYNPPVGSIAPTNETVEAGNTAQFFISPAGFALSYQWQTNTGSGWQNLSNFGQYSGTTGDTLTVSNISSLNNSQQFRCILSWSPCTDTTSVATLSVLTGIENPLNENSFTVWPNPTTGQIEIKINGIGYDFIKIFDELGQEIYTRYLPPSVQNQTLQINLSAFSNGVYVAQAVCPEGIINKRIVIQK